MPLFGGKHPCVYCGLPADTSDHTPPKCLLPRKLPNNVQAMTIPSCIACNQGFHLDEMRVSAVVHAVSFSKSDMDAMSSGGWVRSALDGDRTLNEFISSRIDGAGVFHPDQIVQDVFKRVMTKTTTGLLFHEFGQIVHPGSIVMLGVEHTQNCAPSAYIELHRQGDEGYAEVTPSGRALEHQVLAMYGYESPTMPEWRAYMKGFFEYVFVRRSNHRLLIGLKIHDALTVALESPWPGGAGPRRKGKPRLR